MIDGHASIMPRMRSSNQPTSKPRFSLRPGRPDDYDFAVALYLESTKPLLVALGLWDEKRVVDRFRDGFKPENVQIIRSNGANVGWMQTSESPDGLHVHQIHLNDATRRRGIVTRLIERLQDRARNNGSNVALNVIRGNPAIALYDRLGFRVVGEDDEKFYMRWEPESAE